MLMLFSDSLVSHCSHTWLVFSHEGTFNGNTLFR